jgi:hypothetical protein
MKNTTLPPMKIGKNQTLLPSGVAVSKDGKYHYWQCSVSGAQTFAKSDYWVKIMAKFGTEENLVATYVCKKAKRLLDAGMTQSDIAECINGSVPEKVVKAVKEKKVKVASKGQTVGVEDFATDYAKTVVEPEAEVVYAWSGDPTYFGTGVHSQMSIAEATKDSCAFPAVYLDHDCQGCEFYDQCVCPVKVNSEKWKLPKNKMVAVVRPLSAGFENEDLAG